MILFQAADRVVPPHWAASEGAQEPIRLLTLHKLTTVLWPHRPPLGAAILQCQLYLLPFGLHLQQQHRGLPGEGLDGDPRQPARGHRRNVSAPVSASSPGTGRIGL